MNAIRGACAGYLFFLGALLLGMHPINAALVGIVNAAWFAAGLPGIGKPPTRGTIPRREAASRRTFERMLEEQEQERREGERALCGGLR